MHSIRMALPRPLREGGRGRVIFIVLLLHVEQSKVKRNPEIPKIPKNRNPRISRNSRNTEKTEFPESQLSIAKKEEALLKNNASSLQI